MDEKTQNSVENIAAANEVHASLEKGKLWIRFLMRQWILIGLICVGAGLAGIFYAMNEAIQFESELTFSLDENSSSSNGGLASLAAQFGLGASDNDLFSGDNIVEVIKSRTIIERVLLSTDTFNGKSTSLIEYYNTLSSRKNVKNEPPVNLPPGLKKGHLSYIQDSVLYDTYTNILKNFLTAGRPDKQLNIYILKFRSPNEKFTKIFTEKILSETVKFYTELKTQKSQSTLHILEQRVAELKGNLNASISARAGSEDANVNPTFAEAQVPMQKQQVNMKVYGAAYEELYKNMELARFQYLQNIPLVQVINNADYPMKKIRANKLQTGLMASFLCLLFTVFLLSVFYLIKKK